MEKRYQVFVSSTYEDLQEERKEVMQALLELDCIPSGMELFPASNDDQWTLIKRVIDDCDYYLLIIGGRYGSTNEKGVSYTQMEFEYALQSGKPIISFIHKNPDSIPSGKTEKSDAGKEKLEQFKKMAQRKLVRFWEKPADLGSVVSRSMVRLIKDFPAEGWIRANSAVDLDAAKEISRLQKENRELHKIVHDYEFQASKEIQVLAQGDDLYDVEFVVTIVNSKGKMYKKYVYYQLTWTFLLQKLYIAMMDSCWESDISDSVLSILSPQVETIVKQNGFEDTEQIKSIHFGVGIFRTILIQCSALGLIQSLDDKDIYSEVTGKLEKCWGFTEYGEKEGLRMIAIKRKDRIDNHAE